MKPSPLLILADRGRVIAYQVESTPRGSFPRHLSTTEIEEGQRRASDEVTDRAGAFPVSGTGGQANAAAERMTAISENERRCVRHVAEEISAVVKRLGVDRWSLAAPVGINSAIVDSLPDQVRGQLAQNVPQDLTHLPAAELLSHLEKSTK